MDINGAIAELDKLIEKKGLSYVLYTCRGAQLIFLGFTARRTEDVDLIQDKTDEPLKSEVFINAWVKELKNDLGYN